MELKNKSRKSIMDLNKTTILIGENGVGKTTILKKLSASCFIDCGSGDVPIEVLFAGLENVKEDVDGTKAKYKKSIGDFKDKVSSLSFSNQTAINTELNSALAQANSALNSSLSETIIAPSLEINYSIKRSDTFEVATTFKFNGTNYNLKDLPSGVRKLIHLYFSTKTNSSGMKIILLDEVDSMLHPSWVKLVTSLIKEWMDNPDIILVVTTHKPETLYHLNNYCKSIAKVAPAMNSVEYIDFTSMTRTFNDVNSHFMGRSFHAISETEYENKLKIKMSFQLSRLFFAVNEPLILTEGLTDQMFFKNKTEKMVISIFGFYQSGLVLSIIKWLRGNYDGVSFILDGDGNLSNATTKNYLLKEKLTNLSIANFFFETDLERTQFSVRKIGPIQTNTKFKLLEEHYNSTIIDDDLLEILD